MGVNCPYKWTNCINQEDDQSLSWESELEGEKPEELASLEAPDNEGEWCWPKRNRITRWRKREREDQRPTGPLRIGWWRRAGVWITEPFGLTKRTRRPVDVEERHRCG